MKTDRKLTFRPVEKPTGLLICAIVTHNPLS